MKRVMVRYKVKTGRVEENEALVSRVYEGLARERPAGLRYMTFKLEDGVSFVHVASIETADGANPLNELPEFKAFQEGIGERCDEPSAAVDVSVVGAYGFFDG